MTAGERVANDLYNHWLAKYPRAVRRQMTDKDMFVIGALMTIRDARIHFRRLHADRETRAMRAYLLGLKAKAAGLNDLIEILRGIPQQMEIAA